MFLVLIIPTLIFLSDLFNLQTIVWQTSSVDVEFKHRLWIDISILIALVFVSLIYTKVIWRLSTLVINGLLLFRLIKLFYLDYHTSILYPQLQTVFDTPIIYWAIVLGIFNLINIFARPQIVKQYDLTSLDA